MKENKNIDRLFQEKFRDFEQIPPTHIWSNINSTLSGDTRKKRPILWWWFSGIAAGLALLFTLNNVSSNEEVIPEISEIDQKTIVKPINENEVVTRNDIELITPKTTIKTVKFNKSDNRSNKQNINLKQTLIQSITLENLPILTQDINTSINANNVVENVLLVENTHVNHNQESKKAIIEASDQQQSNSIVDNKATTDKLANQTPITMDEKDNISASDLTLTNNDEIIDPVESKEKWSVTTLAAPMYLNSFNSDISSIDESFDKSIKQGVFSKAYGVQVAYAVSDRLSLQTGLQLVDYGYRTYDVYVSPSGDIRRFSSINYEEETHIEITAEPVDSPNDVYQTFSLGETGDLTQVFGYIEVPIEAKYQIVKGGFGINAVGGISTMILNKNQIFIETKNFTNELGNGVTNLNKLNFTANLGVEFDYKLYKNIHFNLTPMLKVHTNTFTKDTRGFNPYALGVYSGLNYRF